MKARVPMVRDASTPFTIAHVPGQGTRSISLGEVISSDWIRIESQARALKAGASSRRLDRTKSGWLK